MQGKAKLNLDVKGDVTAKIVCKKNNHAKPEQLVPPTACVSTYNVRSKPCAWQDTAEFWTTPPPKRDMRDYTQTMNCWIHWRRQS